MAEKKESLRYFVGLSYYVLGMTDANGKPMMYQREKIEISHKEYGAIKKQIEEKCDRIIIHPMNGEGRGEVTVIHHSMPLAEVSVFYEGRPKHGIVVPEDAGKIITGLKN